MIMILTNECILDDKSAPYLDNLFLSHKYGKHIIALENRTIVGKMLLKIYENDNIISRVIENIYKQETDSKNLLKLVNTYIRINPIGSAYKKNVNDNLTIFEIPVNYFDDQINGCNLVSENSLDIDFYKNLLTKIQTEQKLNIPPKIKFSIEDIPGGGSDTSSIFENKAIYEKKITYLVCDSDIERDSEQYKEHSVAKKIIETQINMDARVGSISGYHILSVREKENLIPPSYYLKHSAFQNNVVLNKLKSLENTEFEELNKYVKLSKSPLKLTDELEQHICLSEYENRALNKKSLHIFSSRAVYSSEFIIQKNLQKVQEEGIINADDEILNGFFFEKLPNYLKQEYEKLIINLMSWSCAYDRVRR